MRREREEMAIDSARREPFALVTQFGLTTQSHCWCETGVSLGWRLILLTHLASGVSKARTQPPADRAFVLSGDPAELSVGNG